RSDELPWYQGPTLLTALSQFSPAPDSADAPLRMRIQDVYRRETQRTFVGRIDSGRLMVGENVAISPARVTARVSSIERWPQEDRPFAQAGEAVGFTLDQPVFVERGDLVSDATDLPPSARSFRALFFWLAEEPPRDEESLVLKFGPTEARVHLDAVHGITDTRNLQKLAAGESPQYSVVDVTLRSDALLALDTREANALTSRCVLLRDDEVLAAGIVTEVHSGPRASNLHPHRHLVSATERAERHGHAGAVVWMTGLSSSGKSTLALALERRLFARGNLVYVLDGDNIRSGLNSDLGFALEDRTENIRRVGEVAALFADAGAIVITAFISPFAADRATARRAAPTAFHEVYVKASLDACEARDPNGLYRRARAGEIAEFTGISSPYEPPNAPELVIDTEHNTPEACVERLLDYVVRVTAAQNLQKV
ncbi:MAG TPA: adenylyl-sulfate kinase, partial [Candidatus Binatia bacterium]|nr:adenylyl-sulfate kinase [Candidatus Binatia bacterium]